MDKETLSNYGWIVICVLVLAVMLALATPFGSFISDAVQSTTQGLFGANQEALGVAGIDIDGQAFNGGNTENGNPVLEEGTKIPEGCSYFVLDENGPLVDLTIGGESAGQLPGYFYKAGDELPLYQAGQTVLFSTPDYDYVCNGNNEFQMAVSDKTKTNYDAIYASINGIPLTNMISAFKNCSALISAPVIPNTVTNMETTFLGCTSLINAPSIPEGVTTMWGTFQGCTSLKNAPTIPNSVTNMSTTFLGCTSLMTAPTIPSNVTKMVQTFYHCHSLTGNIEINATPTNYDSCFYYTTKPITLIGSCENKELLARASTSNNVTVAS